MIVVAVIWGSFLLNNMLSWASARSEARADNIEATFRNILDWCENRGIHPPQRIKEDSIDKHALYTFVRICFWIEAAAFLFFAVNSDVPYLYASMFLLALLINFRAMHGTWYCFYRNKLDKNVYPLSWQTDGDGDTSKMDHYFKDSYSERMLFFCISLSILIIQSGMLLR